MLNKLITNIIHLLPEKFIWIFSKRYIAGKEFSDAVRIIRQLNNKGIKATVDVLGEYIQIAEEAIAYKENYIQIIECIKKEKLKASLSLKPSMFGLLINDDFCYMQLKEVIKKAEDANLSVCMDMEDSSCTQKELFLFEKLYSEFPDTITIALQAYLHRTLDDLKWLKSLMIPGKPIKVRICKGIYVEPEHIAYKKPDEVNNNFLSCTKYMVDNGFFSALATHDKHLIGSLKEMLIEKNRSSDSYEFQMLLGVRPKLRDRIVLKHPLRIYVPFGKHWFGYSTRRLKENPSIVMHILKALFMRG